MGAYNAANLQAHTYRGWEVWFNLVIPEQELE